MARGLLLRLAVWAAFLAFGLAAVAHAGLSIGASGGVFATAQALAREGVPTIGGNTALIGPLDATARGIAYRNGDYWDAHPPLAALLGAPAAWAGVPLADALHAPGEAVLLLGVTGVLLLLAAAAALVWAGERMGMPPGAALLAAVLGVGALLWPDGALTDTIVLTALAGVLLALVLADGADARVEAGWTPRGRLIMTGFVLGLLPGAASFGVVPLAVLAGALVVQGGRRWWQRVGWLLIGIVPPLALAVGLMTAWFGSPLATARQGGVGEGWARSLIGIYLSTPLLVTWNAGVALLQLLARHPLLLVGWVGLLVGLVFVPWRARVNVVLLLVTLGVPALFERQYPGVVAEEHPIAVLGAFAAAGYLLLVALVARDRLRLLPVTFGVGVLLIAAGVGVSIALPGASAPVVPVESNPAVFIAPVGLCAAVLSLLAVPALGTPRPRRRRRLRAGSGAALLLLPFLIACGAPAPGSAPLPVDAEIGPNLLPPFGVRTGTGVTEAVWTLSSGVTPAADGTALSANGAGTASGTAASAHVPVQAGDRYRVSLQVVGPAGAATGSARAIWLDAAGARLGEAVIPLQAGPNVRVVAAMAGATAMQLALALPPGVSVSNPALTPLDGGRLDPWPDYERAALAFSYDWETAMGGLIHTRGGTTAHDVADAEARGIAMRTGAQFLRRTFDAYDLKATWYVNGYNFLTGNTEHRQFAGNPTYTRYNVANAGFLTDYWTTHPWYGDDPYGTEAANPAWYFGSLTKEWLADGQDIQSHSFGHLFLHAGITAQQLDDDLTAWDTLARENGVAPARSFAFPWGASNSLTAEYYAVFAKHGITNVARFYDTKPGTYEIGTVPQRPTIRVMPDTQLITGSEQETITNRGDEMMARRGIDLTLAGGGAWSLWTHPESVTTPTAQALWGRVIGYAADRRKDGLWVVPVTTVMSFAAARDGLHVTSFRVGEQTAITVTNTGTAPVVGATLTLPRTPQRITFTGGNGLPDQREAQVRLGTLGAGQTLTLMVTGP